uniref:Uncharacterized protein n=1 Tax=Rhizophora mucronata TaxID=61149 RepID=A0A2P2QH42_RHIMU
MQPFVSFNLSMALSLIQFMQWHIHCVNFFTAQCSLL